jgi:hypothetical protein
MLLLQQVAQGELGIYAHLHLRLSVCNSLHGRGSWQASPQHQMQLISTQAGSVGLHGAE